MIHIICWSGGKDSTSTVILFHEHEKELLKEGDEVIILFSEVMFDNKKNISGYNPDIIHFIYEKKEIFESWGYKVFILRSEDDFLTRFHGPLKRCPDPARNGLLRGFPLQDRKCWVKRDLKVKPIQRFYKTLDSDYINYIGLAFDEFERYENYKLTDSHAESLLVKYRLTESDAKALCSKYDMLSPQYKLSGGTQKRDGCWFCPYAKDCEHEAIMKAYPEAWTTYVALEDEPNLGYPKWYGYSKETLHERDRRLRNTATKQLSFADFGITL